MGWGDGAERSLAQSDTRPASRRPIRIPAPHRTNAAFGAARNRGGDARAFCIRAVQPVHSRLRTRRAAHAGGGVAPAVDRRQTASMLLANRLVMFGQNIYLLIAVIFLLALFGVVVLAVWTAVRAMLFTRRQRREEAAARAAKLDHDGRPLPPASEGLCDRCQRAFNRVYHVPSGPRLCPMCYELSLPARPIEAAAAPAAAAPGAATVTATANAPPVTAAASAPSTPRATAGRAASRPEAR